MNRSPLKSKAKMEHAAILTVEKRQYRPASWVTHGTHSVYVTLTTKRATISQGIYKGRVFDRNTGAQVCRRDERIGQSYRYSLTYICQ